jgi:hypothetical protein
VNARERLQRVLVTAYPPSFRHRYGDELASLVADNGSPWRDNIDLALGVCRAWVSPVFGGARTEQRRSRLQTTTTTVLAAWCASLLAAAGFSKAVDDPPLPGLHGVALTALHAGAVALEATAAAVLVAGFVFWLVITVPALRAGRRDVVLPALTPALSVGVWLGATGLVALFAHHVVRRANVALTWPRGALILAVLVAWVVVTIICVMWCAGSAALALHRSHIHVSGLAVSTGVAGLAAVGITTQAVAGVVCLVNLARTGGGLDPRDAVISVGSVVILVTVTLMAGVSVTRGLGVLRTGPPGPLSTNT